MAENALTRAIVAAFNQRLARDYDRMAEGRAAYCCEHDCWDDASRAKIAHYRAKAAAFRLQVGEQTKVLWSICSSCQPFEQFPPSPNYAYGVRIEYHGPCTAGWAHDAADKCVVCGTSIAPGVEFTSCVGYPNDREPEPEPELPHAADEHPCERCGRLCHVQSPLCFWCDCYAHGVACVPWAW